MDKRKNSLNTYGISKRRYKELCGFVEQYPEWKEALEELEPSIGSPNMDGMPHGNSTSDAVFNIASKRAELSAKMELIESAAKKADSEFAWYIIQSVCYKVPYYKLKERYDIPITVSSFYDRRRYFFYILSQKR